MLSSLIHKLIYRFHLFGFCFVSFKFYIEDNWNNGNKLKCLFKGIITGLKIFNYKYGYYEYLEVPITTRCSLRCVNCSNLIPCYKIQRDYDVKVIKESVKNFLECINNIVYIRVLGGEPFLSDNLYDVLKLLVKSNKIQRIEIVTNGTIIPKDRKVIRLLRNRRVVVCISQYPMVDYMRLVNFLDSNNIRYRIDKMDYWYYYGDTRKRNKSKKELIKQYSRCGSVCRSLVNGQIHLCPRSSHGTDLGIIKNNSDDYLDLLDNSINVEKRRDKLNKLLKKKYIMACCYCDYGTSNSKRIGVAEQIIKE